MYRVWLEEVLGFKLRGNRLSIEPAIPEDWPGYAITFRYGRTEYRIEVQNNGEGSRQEIRWKMTVRSTRSELPRASGNEEHGTLQAHPRLSCS
jgi:cellobiose phosphorylase